MGKQISIIIPTLNEAATILAALESTSKATHAERIVVDAGSSDDTLKLAESWGARVLQTVCGRARQMNAGAGAARGELLLFLHADTCLPNGFEDHVRQVMAQPGVAAGAFELRIDGTGRSLRIIERLANWRSRRMQLPYGDQAIFVASDRFRHTGGFLDIPIMEDFELISRLRQQGRIVIAPASVTTSARHWKKLGTWQTTLLNQALILGYCLGVAPSRLARWYRSDRLLSS